MSNWGNVLEEAVKISSSVPSLTYLDWKGTPIIESPLPQDFGGFPILYCKRGKIQRLMYEHAKSIGVNFRFGARITSYFEEEDKAGIYVETERITACAIIAADGIHSNARKIVTGKPATARTSGFAIYRTWFNLDTLSNDPLTRFYAESPKDEFHVWLGLNTHCIVMTNTKLRGVVLFCTHEVSCLFPHPSKHPRPIRVRRMIRKLKSHGPLLERCQTSSKSWMVGMRSSKPWQSISQKTTLSTGNCYGATPRRSGFRIKAALY